MRAFTVVREPPRTVVQNPSNYSPVRFGRSGVQQHAADIRQLASKHVCTVCTDRLCHAWNTVIRTRLLWRGGWRKIRDFSSLFIDESCPHGREMSHTAATSTKMRKVTIKLGDDQNAASRGENFFFTFRGCE